MTAARWATGIVVAALLSAGVLVGIGLTGGGMSYGAAPPVRNPCVRHAAFPGGGLDATTQRVALRGLDVAACHLGLTREQLIFALAGQEKVAPSSAEQEAAVRSGLEQAVDEEDLDPVSSWVLRKAIEVTPKDWVLTVVRRLGLLN